MVDESSKCILSNKVFNVILLDATVSRNKFDFKFIHLVYLLDNKNQFCLK